MTQKVEELLEIMGFFFLFKRCLWGGWSSVVKHMLSMYKVLGSIPGTSIKEKKKEKKLLENFHQVMKKTEIIALRV